MGLVFPILIVAGVVKDCVPDVARSFLSNIY